ncbi:MAG: hypothetical protein RJA70_3537 [Pseudomonadota bacterium]|jgi:DUF971 family protein
MAQQPNSAPKSLPKPARIRSPHGADWFEIAWNDGVEHRISNAVLRGYCPCAGCQGHSGPVRFIEGRDSTLTDIQRVGNYALKLVWSDGHSSGLYSFSHLHHLGELFKQHGASLPTLVPELPRRTSA